MIDIADDDGHVVLALGLYVLGALSDDECRQIDEHLAECDACRAEAAEVGEVPAMLAMLSDEDVRELVAEFGPPEAETPVVGTPGGGTAAPIAAEAGSPPVEQAMPVATETPRAGTGAASPLAQRDPAPANRSDPARPSAGRPQGRPARPRRRLFGRTSMVLTAVVVALVTGVALGLSFAGGGGRTPATLTGATTDQVTGAGLSVELSSRGDTVDIRAKVSGVHAGVTYELYAVDIAGRTYSVSRWLGAETDQTIQGDLPVPATHVAFFAVTEMGGKVVVTLRLAAGSAAPSHARTG